MKVLRNVILGLAIPVITNPMFGDALTQSRVDYPDVLVVNEANQMETKSSGNWVYKDGKWYYYYADGSYPKLGLYTIDNQLYAFDYQGQLRVSTYYVTKVNNEWDRYYLADKKGNLTEVQGTGWYNVDGRWYYSVDGVLLKNEVRMINGYYYGFDSYCVMRTDEIFDISDADGNKAYYEALQNGKLLRNTWSPSGKYYYDNSAKRVVNSEYKIGGFSYIFSKEGEVYTAGKYVCAGKRYIVDADSHAHELAYNAWTKVGGEWYYVDKSLAKNCVKKIDNVYYGFDSSGRMIKNRRFKTTYNGQTCYFSAKSDGTLVVNAWEGDYYYGEEGIGATGIVESGGKKYAVIDGELLRNRVVSFEEGSYVVDNKGIATKITTTDGWYKYAGEWYFLKDGKFQSDCKITSAGKDYILDEDGSMLSDRIYYDYDNATYYALDVKGAVITKYGWNRLLGGWYFVNSDGTLKTGLYTEGGKQYYLNPRLVVNNWVWADGNRYAADAKGVLTPYKSVSDEQYIRDGKPFTGWYKSDGAWYYYRNGYLEKDTYRSIDGSYYAFDAAGKMMVNTWVRRWDGTCSYAYPSGKLATGVCTIDGTVYGFAFNGEKLSGDVIREDDTVYLFAADGVLIKKFTNENQGWIKYGNNWYYYNEELYKGMHRIDGIDYIFDSCGRMLTTKDKKINNSIYDATGKKKTGWILYEGNWYYANIKGDLVDGVQMIDGKVYFFESNIMCKGTRNVNGQFLTFGSDGALSIRDSKASGWYYSNGKEAYYKNGKAYTGWLGKQYISGGILQRDTEVYDKVTKKYYYVDEFGNCVYNKWIELYNHDGYAGYSLAKADGSLACDEWMLVGGKWYYFEGRVTAAGFHYIDGKAYWFDNKGNYQGEADTRNGWVYKNSNWYYFQNGYLVEGSSLIDGEWYYFNPQKEMLKDCFVGSYYYESSGKRAKYTGWKKISGIWYYFDEKYECKYGHVSVNNKSYILDAGMKTGYVFIYDKVYKTDSSGVVTGNVKMKTGWVLTDKGYVYFENYNLVDGLRMINGKQYYFEENILTENRIIRIGLDFYYVNSKGEVDRSSGWKKLGDSAGDDWAYVAANGKVYYNGQYTINGKIYAFKNGRWLQRNKIAL